MALVVSAFRMAWVTSTAPAEPPRLRVFGPVSRIAPVAVRMETAALAQRSSPCLRTVVEHHGRWRV